MLPLEKASYRVRAVAADIGMSDNGNRQVSITGRVVDHEHYTDEEITAILHFTEKTQDRSIESLLNFGFPIDDITQLAEADEQKCAELLPEIAEFACAPEEYNGSVRLRVQWVNKPGRGKFTFKNKLEGGDLKAFGAEMKSAFKNARGGAAPRRPAPQNGQRALSAAQHPNAPGSRMDDDIPF
jgi:hypothetical protein